MNKRIRELAWENGCRARKFTKGVAIYPNVDEDLERFALAIIRECMEQVWYTREDGINGNVSEVIKDRIKEHFGVEE